MKFARRGHARARRALPLTLGLVLALLALLPVTAAAHAPVNASPSSSTPFPTTPGLQQAGHGHGAPVADTAGQGPTGKRTRLAVQQTLGEPVAATVEILAGKRTGYLFNASGKQIATTQVKFKATEEDSASRYRRNGKDTLYLLSWGPLAGYWVRLDPAVRLVRTTSWKVLVLVYRQTNLDFVGVGGDVRHLEATMSSEAESLVLKTVSTTPTLVKAWSAGVAAQTQTVVYPARPLTSLSPLGNGAYWAGPWDVATELALYAPAQSYDSVVVLWQPWDAQDSVPSWGWGLGLTPGPYSNGAAYATITAPPPGASWWVTSLSSPGEVYLHEWLHGVIDYHVAHGAQIPALHDNARFGYSDQGGSWQRWYSDLMQRHVRDPLKGAAAGIGHQVWQAGTPSLLP